MTHPLIRKSAESGAVMESGASAGMLWPVEVVDRWISDPRQPVDTRLAIIQEAADGHEVSGFDVAVVPEDMAIQTNLDQGCHVDLLETIARTELRNLEADEGAGGSDWSPVNGKTERVVIDSDAMEVSAERNRFLRPPGGGGGSGSNAPSTVAAPSPSAEMSEGSDEEGRKHPKRIVIAGAPRRGKHAGAGYKALLSSHVTLQDPTGSTAPARVVSTRGGGSKDAPVVSADAKMTRKRRLAELEGQPRPLEVHYVLRPLPLSDLGIAANSAVAWEEDEVAKDGQRGVKVVGLASGCFYGSAEEVLPFALYNPDCRDDVLWNVAAMQAVDVAGSFGIPQNPGEDAVEPELCNVWGAVVEAMNLPPRPIDNIGLLSANAAKELTSIKLNADSSYKGPHSFNAANASSVSSPASSDAEEGDLEGSDDEETAGSGAPRKIVKKDVWGLKKESHLVPALLRAIGSSNWVGNDAVQPPKLGRFDTFIQRFRLGSERMQVGDLVRLGGRRLMGRQTQKKALVVPRGTDFERLVAAQRRRFERGGGIPSALNGVFEPGMEDKTVPLHRSLQQVVLKINEAGIAVVETIPPPEAPPLPVEIPPAGLGSKGDPEAPYGLSLPTTDGVEYLEISYIVLRRPKPITPLAWRGSVGTHGMDLNLPPLTGPAARPSVLVTGRVYHRIASDGRASRDVPLWFPTGEVRTVNAVAGEVLCRVHSQFPNANLVWCADWCVCDGHHGGMEYYFHAFEHDNHVDHQCWRSWAGLEGCRWC
ncbi:hypothetical protein BC830DRAFT_541925 [Chytriomyces sp. MP71]|nr:hypothetical protein BC830DRAFT_541925 [Chytriomyces sp. MP71]